MRHKVQALVDAIYEDTMFQSSPRAMAEHPLMAEIVVLPKTDVTIALLEMLDMDPTWVVFLALQKIHGDDGAKWPHEANGRFTEMRGYWLVWGEERGFFSSLLAEDDD